MAIAPRRLSRRVAFLLRQRQQLRAQAAAFVEELLWLIAPYPALEYFEMFGIAPGVVDRHLVRARTLRP